MNQRISNASSPFPPTFEAYVASMAKNIKEFYIRYADYTDDKTAFPHNPKDILENWSDNQIFENSPNTHDMGSTEEEFMLARESKIQELIEKPCQNLARKLMDLGFETYYSNAYGPGEKGVYWQDVNDENLKLFTSIVDGKTYFVDQTADAGKMVQHFTKIDFDCEADVPFEEEIKKCLPENLSIEMHFVK